MSTFAFLTQVFLHPGSAAVLLLYAAAQVWSHLYAGYSASGSLQALAFTLLVYVLALLTVHTLSGDHSGRFQARRLGAAPAQTAFILHLVLYGFLFMLMIDRQQRLGYLSSPPLLRLLPGWEAYQSWTQGSLVHTLAVIPGWSQADLSSLFLTLPFFVLLPLVVLLLAGVRPGKFGWSGGEIKAALPFLGIFGAAFVFAGVSLPRLGLLLLTLLGTAFQEGFFFRAALQPLWTRVSQDATWGISLAAILYGLLYLPQFLFRSGFSVPMAFAASAGVMLWGAFLGYGVHRSGMLWPWVVIHALYNLTSW